MNFNPLISRIENSLARNAHCSAGLIAQNLVFGIQHGPSGGPEILAVIYADDSFFGYWYGHILRHPEKPKVFVSLIVWSNKLVNASNVPLLFRRFHYWIKDRLEYHPCAVQSFDDAYQESSSLQGATECLAQMIKQFSLDKRQGFEGSDYESSPPEMRIINIYGLVDTQDANGRYPAIPMPTLLRSVKTQAESN